MDDDAEITSVDVEQAALRAEDLDGLLNAVQEYVDQLFGDLDICIDPQEHKALTRQLDVLGQFLIDYERM